MDPFLSPIEKPQSAMMRLAYVGTRRQFGKVLTPIKVFCARMPAAFGVFYAKIAKLDRRLELAGETVLLVREMVARINGCEFGVDIGRSLAIKASLSEEKFNALDGYGASPLFTGAERALLDYVTEVTRDHAVQPATFARLNSHYRERAICEIVWLVASEHFYNISSIGLNIRSDMLSEIARMRRQRLAAGAD